MSWISQKQQQRDHTGLRETCAACGHDATPQDPLAVSDTGSRVHARHLTDPDSGLHGAHQRR